MKESFIDPTQKGIQLSSNVSNISTGAGLATGTGTAIYSYMTSEFIFSAIGAACAVLSILVTIYFNRKRNELEQTRIENEHAMAVLAEERRQRESDAWIASLENCPANINARPPTLPPSDFAPMVLK